ncbi:MAG TPA: nucleotidyltransferase domain-containing protein [Chitinophagaceae bacterium]|nr:nucleotidyltransferase domain-containing protein [Chitinophagaceae bacterium]
MATAAIQTLSPQHNTELAAIFHRMAACYKYKGKEERFRAIAYDVAAKTISSLRDDISLYANDVKTLDQLHGIGESIGEKIIEYLHTGKIKTFEKLKKEVPQDLIDLMDIKGFGPSTIKVLHDVLKVNNREELIEALEKDKLIGVKGFGKRRIENIKRVLKLNKDESQRMPLKTAERIGNEILNEVLRIPGVIRATLAGSLRRKKETIGDIDIIVTAPRKKWKSIVNKFVQLPQVSRVQAVGETRGSVLLKENNIQVDIRIVHEHEYGAALLYFTGNKEHNIKIRTIAREKGWKINEYGVFDIKTGKVSASATEEEIYKLLGLKFVPPEKRLGKNELEKVEY